MIEERPHPEWTRQWAHMKLTKAELQEIWRDIPVEMRGDDEPATKADLIEDYERHRRRHLNERHRATAKDQQAKRDQEMRMSPTTIKAFNAARCEIPASEVDEWLATLPEWMDEQQQSENPQA